MRNIQLPTMLSNYNQIEDITDQLPHHPTKVYKLTEIEKKDVIVIHHTAQYAPLQSHAAYHVNTHGWPGIGYHVMLSEDHLYQVNDIRAESYHTKDHNNHTIGICINADLSKRSITDRERELLAVAIITVKSLVPTIKAVVPHNALVATSCPCTSVPAILEVVQKIEQEMAHAQSPQKKEEMSYRVANELLYLYSMSKGKDSFGKEVNEQQKVWAQNRLLTLVPEMQRLGFLK
jgi:hypothetical protein